MYFQAYLATLKVFKGIRGVSWHLTLAAAVFETNRHSLPGGARASKELRHEDSDCGMQNDMMEEQ